MVFKVINKTYNTEEIKNALLVAKLEKATVFKVDRMKSKRRDENGEVIYTNSCVVQFTSESDTNCVYKVKKLCDQIIRWEPLRRKKLFQCYRC